MTDFLDIGSGDGALVLGAALLYQDYLESSCGVDLVKGLVERSKRHQNVLEQSVGGPSTLPAADFIHGNVYNVESEPILRRILSETTLAVGFVTTCSANNTSDGEKNSLDNRKLPEL
jgi:hypothetical protein